MTPKIRFSTTDLYLIDGVGYHYETCDENAAFFRRDDGSAAIELFPWETLRALVGGPRWDCRLRTSSLEEARGAPDPYHGIWEEPAKQRTLILARWFFVSSVDKLYHENRLTLHPASVTENYPQIHAVAAAEWRAFREEYGPSFFSSMPHGFAFNACATSILRWRRQLHAANGRVSALKDRRGRKSKLEIDQESYRFIIEHLREYLYSQRHTARDVVDKTIIAQRLENKRRTEAGEPTLQTRGKTTLHQWLRSFDKLEVDAGRHGLAQAKRKFLGIGKTDGASRPGQTVQVDEWAIDARNIILNGPIREGLDQKTLDRLPRDRRWMYVVIDVATRYILALVIASSQNSDSAVRALAMATQDKSDLAKAAGALCDWRGFPFECVESDTGTAFRAEATRRAVTETHATYSYPTVGEPQLRGRIERYFLTHSKRAMPYVPGRTFESPKARGDHDTEGQAVLTDDQLALIFIRYIVDVYHRVPHSGLLGESPAAALERLGGTVGLPPQIPLAMRRRAFGLRLSATVTAKGVKYLGIQYNSETLQHVRREPGSNEVNFYLDPRDLGTISVWNGTEWLEVGSSIENFRGVTLEDWIAVGKILRPRYGGQAELSEHIVFEAYKAMRARATEAQRIMRALPQQPTAEDLKRLDQELYAGLSIVEDDTRQLCDLKRVPNGIGYVIGETSLDAFDASAADDGEREIPDQEDQAGSEADDDGWWRGEEEP